jgi:hypothetical protein
MGNLKDFTENFITAKKEPKFLVIGGELKSLRINQNTIIQVPESKCNEEYRQEYLERIKSKQY